MRELKFRVYIPDHEKFCYFTLGNFDYSDRYLHQHSYPVQQYTGLQDKHEKDIYEGDILFFQQQDGVWPNQLNKHIEVKYPFVCGNAHLGEIIGNIFENSELLNQ